jgi:demethylmenaquinone methyltransferase/2-methoxy-6-polyprenyl-1,4-benzoquinol methylase
LSGGSDWYWRWRAVRALALPSRATVLDLCTGTGDVALEVLRRRPDARVIGVDFAAQMLRIGHGKIARRGFAPRAPLLRGDAMHVPLAACSVDAATMAFGIRNVQRPDAALREIARVLRQGGRLAVLEFSMPTLPGIAGLYAWYFRNVLPRVGRAISRHGDAYTYLPSSVGAFFTPEQFASLLREAGFGRIRAIPLTLGVVHLYLAERP